MDRFGFADDEDFWGGWAAIDGSPGEAVRAFYSASGHAPKRGG